MIGALALLAPSAAVLPAPPIPPERTCLAQAISYESGAEPEEGQEAVAQVVLNRLHDPAYPKTICEVVFQGAERRNRCQFTFACDGSLLRRRPVNWFNALRIADAMLDGTLAAAGVGDATHYHAFYVQPAWAARMTRIARIGAHIFYSSRPGALASPAPAASTSAPARPATFSAWGLQTAMLLPGRGGVRVAPVPTPPPAAGRAAPPFP